MKNIILFLLLITASYAVTAQEVKYEVTSSSIGLLIHYQAAPYFKYSIYRGTTPENLELIAENITGSSPLSNHLLGGRYLDETAIPNTQYFYKVVGETDLISAVLDRPENILLARNFVSQEFLGPNISSAAYASEKRINVANGNGNGGYSWWSSHKDGASYSLYIKDLTPGKQYIMRITFGKIIGINNLTLSLSPRKPVANLLVPHAELINYADKTVDFYVTAGPVGWSSVGISSTGPKGSDSWVYIKEIKVIDLK